MKKYLFFIILGTTLGFSASPARSVSYLSPKRMAMGGAGVAVVHREDSYLYNPAHAAVIKHSLHLPPFLLLPNNIYSGTSLQDLNTVIDTVQSSSDDKDSQLDVFRELIPSRIGLGGGWSGGLVFDTANWGAFALGAYAAGKLNMEILNALSPRLETLGYFDAVFPAFTYASEPNIDNLEDFIFKNPKLGITVKNIIRYASHNPDNGQETISLEALELLDKDATVPAGYRAGRGVGVDLGGLAEVEDTVFGNVTVGLVFQNIATNLHGKQYEPVISSANAEDADNFDVSSYSQNIPLTMTLGAAAQGAPFAGLKQAPYLSWLGTALDFVLPSAVYAADIEVIAPESSFYKRLHVGLEQSYWNGLLDLRAGLNQGYPTLGFNCNFGFYHLGFTYYTEELGVEVGEHPQSYYVLHSSFVF